MLTKEEFKQITKQWNRTSKNYAPLICLHEHFEKQVIAARDSIALICRERHLTYGQLNKLANQFAHYLIKAGVGPESLVGIHVRRDIEMVVALLGILKSGGAYVPLDPSYPVERLNYILQDSRASILINDETTQNQLNYRGTIVNIRKDWEQIEKQSSENPNIKIKPSNMAYVIYTSGSTGRPKGVCITHSNASTLLYWSGETYSVKDLECVLAATSISFDLSVFEMFAPLAKGGKILLAENILSVPALLKEPITLINTVPSALTEILSLCSLPPSVRVVNLAGEPLPLALVKKVYENKNVDRVINLYGPSEDTTYSTIKEISRDAVDNPPIGRPISNTEIYLLDDERQPVAIGETGEIYIAGDGAARGYLNNPELTAERFIPNPFSKKYARLYKTGDLARYLPNGDIQFIGRKDNQIKIRGFRVEPEEVEKNINQFNAVQESAVTVLKDDDGINKLIAFLVIKEKSSFSIHALRRLLIDRLPSFMIPSVFLSVQNLPRTNNGKIARKELTNFMSAADRLPEGKPIPVETQTQKNLAKIFENVLNLKIVGLSDNFFSLGGHSLLVIRLVAQVDKTFKIRLSFSDVFENPTIARLADLIENHQSAQSRHFRQKQLKSTGSRNEKFSFPATVAQERMWQFYKAEPRNPVNNISAVWRHSKSLDISILKKSIYEIIKRQRVFQTRFTETDNELRQVVSPLAIDSDESAFAELDFSVFEFGADSSDKDIYKFIKKEVFSPFDLSRGNLLRIRVLKFGDNDYRIVLTIHHIIGDGWSLDILLRELETIYNSFIRNKKPRLAPLKSQYTDFAEWQSQWLQGKDRERETEYWLNKLSGTPEYLRLPTRRPSSVRRDFLKSFKGNYIEFQIDKKFVEAARIQCRQMNITLFVYLLSAFYAVLAGYSRQKDIVVGVNVAGRAKSEFENVVGLFTNHLALRVNFSESSSFVREMEKVKNTFLEAYEHQNLPLKLLLQRINSNPDNPEYALPPPYQVKFVYDNENQNLFRLLGIDERKFEKNLKVKLDIILHIFQDDGEILGRWIYNSELFSKSTASRMSSHYKKFVETTASSAGENIVGLLESSRLLIK